MLHSSRCSLVRRSMGGVRDITFPYLARVRESLAQRRQQPEFSVEGITAAAASAAGLSCAPATIPDAEWWRRLCHACAEKKTSAVGRLLLYEKLVHCLSQRLAVDEMYRLNGHEIEKEVIAEPLLIIGLPRTGGHFLTHLLARSGLFLCPMMRDTYSPSLVSEVDRDVAYHRDVKKFLRATNDFACVRVLENNSVDDDIALHLHVPFSYAWGLLHGLDEHLLNSLQEDQQPVFDYVKRVLKLFQWLHQRGHFPDCVTVEHVQIDNVVEKARYGDKPILLRRPWVLHSPFGLLNSHALHNAFPDMKVIWTHRALSASVPSLCSSLAIHNAVYTGTQPTETSLAQLGEKVLGIFGSGSENAIEYFADFERKRMVHLSYRDVQRHGVRIMARTIEHLGFEIDRQRRNQSIDASTEFLSRYRPLHDAEMRYFGLHDGVVNQVFSAYIHQFEEFAFEKKFGVTIQNYESITGTVNGFLPSKKGTHQTLSSSDSSRSRLGDNQPAAGHFLQDSNNSDR